MRQLPILLTSLLALLPMTNSIPVVSQNDSANHAQEADSTAARKRPTPVAYDDEDSQINVMAQKYGARGDCRTDDTPAFTSAQAAAIARGSNFSWPPVLYLPKPPGGCYLLKTQFVWLGVSMEGKAPNSMDSHGHSGVIIQGGTPGADVFLVPDPTTSALSSFRGSWSLRHLTFIVNQGAPNVTHPHRWPGRWFDDGAMKAGSNIFKSTRANIGCGDIGQPIQVNGAGPSGANLVSTIASVSPCWAASDNSFLIVTLAANASTTVSNAHSYISVGGLPVTTNVGGCGIAFDDQDGNPADWVPGAISTSGGYSLMEDVTFRGSSLAKNINTCGLFFQGQATQYGLTLRDYSFQGLMFGLLAVPSERNSYYASNMGDFDTFSKGHIGGMTFPWITYNGLSNTINQIEFNADNGPMMLSLGNQWGDVANSWNVSGVGYNGAASNYGWRINGNNWTFRSVTFAALASQVATLDTSNTVITNGGIQYGTLAVNGTKNDVNGQYMAIADGGIGNVYKNTNTSAYDGFPSSYFYSAKPYKGAYRLAGRVTPDFIRDGNPATPYNYDDLFFWPQDFIYNSYGAANYSTYFSRDSTSPTGAYWNFVSGNGISSFQQFIATTDSGYALVGTNVPATKATVYFLAKCLNSVTSGQFNVLVNNGRENTTIGTSKFSCTANYAPYSVAVDLSSYKGAHVLFLGGTSRYQVAWIAIRPYLADFNGIQPAPLTSPAFTGNPTAPTQAPGDNSTKLATTAFVEATCSTRPDSRDFAETADARTTARVPETFQSAATISSQNSPVLAGYPRVVAAVAQKSYSGTSGVNYSTVYTTPLSGGAGQYRLCSDHVVTSAGTAGVSYGQIRYVSNSHAGMVARTTGNTSLTAQYSDSASSGTFSCPTFWADANTQIQFQIVFSGAEGNPQISYSVTLERLQ